MLEHTDERFLEELRRRIPYPVFLQHTGGGVWVTVIDLTIDARGLGPQVWITREEDWLVGAYDFEADPEDEGDCLELMTVLHGRDDPEYVTKKIARVLEFFRRTFRQLDREQQAK